jgi:hypothetical protein
MVMSKTYRAMRPNADILIPAGRAVKESTVTRFTRAWKKITHHQARRQAVREIREAL